MKSSVSDDTREVLGVTESGVGAGSGRAGGSAGWLLARVAAYVLSLCLSDLKQVPLKLLMRYSVWAG